MEKPIDNYWTLRLTELKHIFEANNFNVHLADSAEDAKTIVLDTIIPKIKPKSVSWGGSMTFKDTGLYDAIKQIDDIDVLDTFDKSISRQEMQELRRQALLTDLFITGTNAVTETGQLVNLDMIGNRVAGITFGPNHVIILVGRNKVVSDFEEAVQRIKNYTAPTNVMRLDKKAPCSKTGCCEDCNSPDRICNTWTITDRSFPKGRITLVLINEDMGL